MLRKAKSIEKKEDISFKLVSRNHHKENTIIKIDGIEISGTIPIIMASPSAIENEDQVFKTTELLKKLGVPIMRGGIFKPRTSPYSFQGLKENMDC